jgi:molecular chaperone HtpG
MATQQAQQREKMEFQAEVQQLLHLMINAIYSDKDIFIRELISNASDALDKRRLEALTDKNAEAGDHELAIHISVDKNAKTFTITDNGIGMTRQEVVDNLGTIARSGSRRFLENLTGDQKADSNLIGKFGVGFYSVFMVASKVMVRTKRAGSDEPPIFWESDGSSAFEVGEADKTDAGTEITVYLKDDAHTYAEDWQVRSIIKKYSDFVAFPIYFPDDKGKEEMLNETKPLWKKSPSEITGEQYEEFYKQSLGGFDKPLATLHTHAEGTMEFSSLIFIPETAPFDLYNVERSHGVKLYVKRVFIMDNCKELVPEYLRFVKGVIDSEDLPLNISREMLQKNSVVDKIRKNVVGKILNKLKDMAAKEPDTYKTFWRQFGAVLKEGVHTDFENKETLQELLRFESTMTEQDDTLVSLKGYVDRMKEGQKDIYYITGESRELVKNSPHLEVFRDKGIEVLYMCDPIDEWIVHDIHTYAQKPLKSIAKGDIDLDDVGPGEEKKNDKKKESKYKKLTQRIKNILGDEVKEVRTTNRLTDSPSCMVSDENDMGPHMEKIMKAMGQEVPAAKRTLEINPAHPLVERVNELYTGDPKSDAVEDWARLLYEQALIAEGKVPADPLAYTSRVNRMLQTCAAAGAASQDASA